MYGLAVDHDSILMDKEEMEFEFYFDIDEYIVLAQILLKMDKNLHKTRHMLVPEMIEEDEFWRNYFYKIECFKAELGIESRLGRRLTVE